MRRKNRKAINATTTKHRAAKPADDSLSQSDLELAAWLATAGSEYTELEDVTYPLSWPAAARRELEQLISRLREVITPASAGERHRLAARVHELCEQHCVDVEWINPEELADALAGVLTPEAWRLTYRVREVA